MTDEEAERLMRDHGALIWGTARRWAGTDADTADLTQDIWMRVVRLYPPDDPGTPIRAWIRVVAFNVCSTWLRARRRRRRLSAETSRLTDAGDGGSPPDCPEHRVNLQLWSAVDELPELQKKVVMLRVSEGMSTREAAAAINRTEGTVMTSLHRAMKRLRRELSDLGPLWDQGEI